MPTGSPLRLSPSVLLSTASDGYVAYDVRLDRLYRLNPTAALIVELCDGTRDFQQLQADLSPLMGDDWPGCLDWIATARHRKTTVISCDSKPNRANAVIRRLNISSKF